MTPSRRKAFKKDLYRLIGGSGVRADAAPAGIERTLPRRRIRQLPVPVRARLSVQFFPDGPWDLAAEPFDLHRYVREIFVDGVPVRESEQYRDMVARVSDPRLGGSMWGCRTVADVDRYFDELQRMFEDMRAHGYRSHLDLGMSPHEEVKVWVGRDGGLIKASGGNHRVSFAKLLELGRIPVLVSGVHKVFLHRLARRRDSWSADTLAEALEAAGLLPDDPSEVERVARRLALRDVTADIPHLTRRRRRGIPVLLASCSVHDDIVIVVYAAGLFGA